MRKVLMLLVFFALCLAARAQKTDKGNFVTKVNAIPKGYNFWVYTPTEYEVDQHPLPLVIFLHGASLCGNNLQRVRRYGVLDAIDRGKIIPTLVVAPQNPGGAWSPQKINDLLEWTKVHYRVDTTRVYELGRLRNDGLCGRIPRENCCSHGTLWGLFAQRCQRNWPRSDVDNARNCRQSGTYETIGSGGKQA